VTPPARRLFRRGKTWSEAEVNRIAGEIMLRSAELNAAKAEAYLESALTVSRQQQAKSWELRAAMSMARLWRDQGKRDEARDLLAPVYGWFTEGFDTLDLKERRRWSLNYRRECARCEGHIRLLSLLGLDPYLFSDRTRTLRFAKNAYA
jgi:predicted ATPase